MLDPIEHATNEYYKNIEYNEQMLEDFNLNIRRHLKLIEDSIDKIKAIEKEYPSFDFEAEWVEAVKDMM